MLPFKITITQRNQNTVLNIKFKHSKFVTEFGAVRKNLCSFKQGHLWLICTVTESHPDPTLPIGVH